MHNMASFWRWKALAFSTWSSLLPKQRRAISRPNMGMWVCECTDVESVPAKSIGVGASLEVSNADVDYIVCGLLPVSTSAPLRILLLGELLNMEMTCVIASVAGPTRLMTSATAASAIVQMDCWSHAVRQPWNDGSPAEGMVCSVDSLDKGRRERKLIWRRCWEVVE